MLRRDCSLSIVPGDFHAFLFLKIQFRTDLFTGNSLHLKIVTQSNKLFITKASNLVSGTLKLAVSCNGPYTLQVTGSSPLDFTYQLLDVEDPERGTTRRVVGNPLRGKETCEWAVGMKVCKKAPVFFGFFLLYKIYCELYLAFRVSCLFMSFKQLNEQPPNFWPSPFQSFFSNVFLSMVSFHCLKAVCF